MRSLRSIPFADGLHCLFFSLNASAKVTITFFSNVIYMRIERVLISSRFPNQSGVGSEPKPRTNCKAFALGRSSPLARAMTAMQGIEVVIEQGD